MTPRYPYGAQAQALRAQLTPLVGKTITLTDHNPCIDAALGYGRTGMRARIAAIIVTLDTEPQSPGYAQPIAYVEFDYTGFEEHNTPFEEGGWCDNEGKGDYTCKSLGLYTGRDLSMIDPLNPTEGFALLDV